MQQRLAGGCPTALQVADVARHRGNQNDVGHGRRGGTEERRTLFIQTLCSKRLAGCRSTALQYAEVVRHVGKLDDVDGVPVRWHRRRMDETGSEADSEEVAEAAAKARRGFIPMEHSSWPNNKRVSGIERCFTWLRGKSSGDRNPMGGCGVKQNHEAQAGSNR